MLGSAGKYISIAKGDNEKIIAIKITNGQNATAVGIDVDVGVVDAVAA